MLKKWMASILLSTIAFTCVALSPGRAEAKGIPLILYSTGEEIYEVADMPKQLTDLDPSFATWKLSYKCEHFALFWADIARWDCTLVAYDGENTFADLPEELRPAIQEEYPLGFFTGGLWQRFGVVILGIAVVGVVVLAAMAKTDEYEEEASPQ